MTPQYILRKSLCRAAHCYSAHVPGQGYTNNGQLSPTVFQYILDKTGLVEETPLLILADKLDDIGEGDTADRLRVEIARIDDYNTQRTRSAMAEIDNLGYARHYAEPGYTDPAKGVLFANWNVFPRGVDTILERYGYEIEWSDEWSTCSDCGAAVRTNPDGYDWIPYYLIGDGELVCLDCHRANQHDEDSSADDDESNDVDDIALYPLDDDKQEIDLSADVDYKPNHDFHLPF